MGGTEKTITNEDVGDSSDNQVYWFKFSSELEIVGFTRPYANDKNRAMQKLMSVVSEPDNGSNLIDSSVVPSKREGKTTRDPADARSCDVRGAVKL